MNIHPLFVHFPIGILVLYTAFEVLRFRFITKQHFYFEFKALLVIIGAITAFITATTGEMAEEILLKSTPELASVIERHAMFAGLTIFVYTLLASAYLLRWLDKSKKLIFLSRFSFIKKLVQIIIKISPLLALLGLLAITVTGGIGASLVYGPNVDPFVTYIYQVFVLGF